MSHPKCPGHSRQTGKPCGNVAGFRTDHVGGGLCFVHGGMTPNGIANGKRKVTEARVANALATLHIETSVDPTSALLEALRVACWKEAGLRRMLAERPALFGPDHLDDDRPDVVATMHDHALDLRAKIAKMAIDAGIDAALVRIAERQAEVTIRAIQAALDVMVDTGDRARAEAAAADVLEAVMPAGPSLN